MATDQRLIFPEYFLVAIQKTRNGKDLNGLIMHPLFKGVIDNIFM